MPLQDPAFRAIFEDAPFGIAVADAELKVVDVNDAYCEMLGRTEAEVMALRVPDYTHPEDQQRDREFMPLVLSGQLPRYTADKRYLRKDGSVVWARIVVTPLLDPSGRSRYVFSFVRPLAEDRIWLSLSSCPSCRRVREPGGTWITLRENRCPDCALP
jgi:PAS domain S-box-containing protein